MSTRTIHIYPPTQETTVVGFSHGIPDVKHSDATWKAFMAEHELAAREMQPKTNPVDRQILVDLGGVSFQYVEFKPPMSDEQIRAFSGVCKQLIDPINDTVMLIDSRNDSLPYLKGKVISRW